MNMKFFETILPLAKDEKEAWRQKQLIKKDFVKAY